MIQFLLHTAAKQRFKEPFVIFVSLIKFLWREQSNGSFIDNLPEGNICVPQVMKSEDVVTGTFPIDTKC